MRRLLYFHSQLSSNSSVILGFIASTGLLFETIISQGETALPFEISSYPTIIIEEDGIEVARLEDNAHMLPDSIKSFWEANQ